MIRKSLTIFQIRNPAAIQRGIFECVTGVLNPSFVVDIVEKINAEKKTCQTNLYTEWAAEIRAICTSIEYECVETNSKSKQ